MSVILPLSDAYWASSTIWDNSVSSCKQIVLKKAKKIGVGTPKGGHSIWKTIWPCKSQSLRRIIELPIRTPISEFFVYVRSKNHWEVLHAIISTLVWSDHTKVGSSKQYGTLCLPSGHTGLFRSSCVMLQHIWWLVTARPQVSHKDLSISTRARVPASIRPEVSLYRRFCYLSSVSTCSFNSYPPLFWTSSYIYSVLTLAFPV